MSRTDVRRRRILVVDDEPDSARTMALLLERMGAEVATAHDGRQAIETAASFRPEMVILDIGLPDMDGYETARRIRAAAADRPVTLIALTGWGRDEDARRSLEAGFQHHLVKPLDPAALERLLASVAPGSAPSADRPVRSAASPAPAPVPAGRLLHMTHDIRTPLNTIAGAAQLLLDTPLDAEQRELVEAMRRSGESLQTILEGIAVGAGAAPTARETVRHAVPPMPPLRVLVCDDDPICRRMAILVLADLELSADVAASGREALAAVSRTTYDAVFIDARMPGMDGAETVREIHRLSPTRRRPYLISMTASAAPSEHTALLKAGADACLTKPLTAESTRAALAGVPAADGAHGAAPATLDAAVMNALRSAQGGAAVMGTLIDLFLADAPIQMSRLRQAAVRGDAAEIGEVAHRLRGSGASIGAARLVAAASEVESSARRGDLAGAATAIESLEGAWLVSRAALERARRASA